MGFLQPALPGPALPCLPLPLTQLEERATGQVRGPAPRSAAQCAAAAARWIRCWAAVTTAPWLTPGGNCDSKGEAGLSRARNDRIFCKESQLQVRPANTVDHTMLLVFPTHFCSRQTNQNHKTLLALLTRRCKLAQAKSSAIALEGTPVPQWAPLHAGSNVLLRAQLVRGSGCEAPPPSTPCSDSLLALASMPLDTVQVSDIIMQNPTPGQVLLKLLCTRNVLLHKKWIWPALPWQRETLNS
jgi:hypothetical protein